MSATRCCRSYSESDETRVVRDGMKVALRWTSFEVSPPSTPSTRVYCIQRAFSDIWLTWSQ